MHKTNQSWPRTVRDMSLTILWLAMSAGLAIAVWEAVVTLSSVQSYVLPPPADVWRALVAGIIINPTSPASFLYQLEDTLHATILGFLIAAIIGIALAAVMAEYRVMQRLLFPYVVFLQSIPKIAIAPLFVIWFGYQLETKVAMAATITLFPILLNSLEGFAMVERERLELMMSLDASRWQSFWLIKLPSAAPFIFAGLNLGIVYALLGAIISEFLGAQRGVGVVITQLQSVSDTAGVFALLVVLAVTSYALIEILRALQRYFVFWSGTSHTTKQEF
jgi:NitT/TauT family transport system permease protein